MSRILSNTLSSSVASVVLFVAGATAVRAELIAYEGVDYDSEGSLFDAGSGSGWGGATPVWTKVSSDETKPNQTFNRTLNLWECVDTNGNRLVTSGSARADWYNGDTVFPWGTSWAQRSFASPVDTSAGNVLWLSALAAASAIDSRSVLIRPMGAPSSGAVFTYRDTDGVNKWGLTYVTTKTWRSLVNKPVTNGVARLLVAKFAFTATQTQVKLWVSPGNIGAGESGLGTANASQTWGSSTGSPYTGLALGSSESLYAQFDEIRVGTTVEDVLPFIPPPPRGTVVLVR